MDLFAFEQIEEKYKDDITQVLWGLWLLWGFAFISLPSLIVMSIIFSRFRQEAVTPADSLEILIPVFSVIAIGSQFAAVLLRNAFLSSKMNNFYKICLRFSAGGDSEFVVLCVSGLFLPAVISFTPASMGALLLIMGASPWLFYVFVIFGALGMIYHRPQKDVVIDFIVNDQKSK